MTDDVSKVSRSRWKVIDILGALCGFTVAGLMLKQTIDTYGRMFPVMPVVSESASLTFRASAHELRGPTFRGTNDQASDVRVGQE